MSTAILGLENAHSATDTLAAATVNSIANILEWLVAGPQSVDCSGSADVTLTSTQYGAVLIELTGILTGDIDVIVPTHTGRRWVFYNATSGSFTVTVKTAAGSGITVTQGYKAGLYCDGTDVVRATLDTAATALVVTTIGPNGTQQHTVPAVASDAFALLAATQTFTNKTLTSPRVGTSLLDTNGNELFLLTATGSAVNEITLANAATGGAPSLTASGSDSNVGLNLGTKGTGVIRVNAPIKGNAVAQSRGRATKALSDANYTVLNTEYDSAILEFTGALTAGRDIILPNTDGAQFTVYNNTTGGFNLTFKVSGQTGIAVAATKRAIIYCNGTDYVRATADA